MGTNTLDMVVLMEKNRFLICNAMANTATAVALAIAPSRKFGTLLFTRSKIWLRKIQKLNTAMALNIDHSKPLKVKRMPSVRVAYQMFISSSTLVMNICAQATPTAPVPSQSRSTARNG